MENKNNIKINKLLVLGKQHHQNNNFTDALKIYEEILNIDSTHFETIFFLGTLKAQTKKFKEAKELLKKAIEIRPEIPDLYNNIGLIFREIKDFDQSLRSFKKAIQINPEYAIAFNNLGIVYKDLDNIDKAEKNFLQSIKLNPNNSDPYNNLGIIYNDENQTDKAKDFFYKSLKINPKNLQTLNNLGNLYKNIGQIEKAEKYFFKALDVNSKFFETYNNLMVMYERTNLNDKLKEMINKTNEVFSSNNITKLFLGHYLFKIKKFSESIECLNQINFSENQLNRERLRCLILAKNYDKLSNANQAFNFFKKTNEINLSQKKNDINKDHTLNIITKRIEFYNNENVSNWSLNYQDNQNCKPIFLIGFPRSGTTLLDTILRSHPSIQVIEEKPLVEKLIISIDKQIDSDFKNLKNLNQNQIKILQNQYCENLLKYTDTASNTQIFIDKMPLNIIHIGEIIRVFPNAKFILALRHPCDSVLSCYMQSFKLNNAMANFLDIENAANIYNEVMKLWIQYTKLFSINLHVVKYEDVINNFNITIKDTLNFLNLSWTNDVEKFYETADKKRLISTPSYDQVNQPIYLDSLYRWKKYEVEISKILPILEPWIKKFDY
jgi:tetratricopeptide (TPR) repeat protein